MENELLVKSIRDLCKKNNIAISQLETELNFGAGLISRWNKNSPSIDKIVDIADYFHVSLNEVVGYTQNTNDVFLNKLYEQTSNGSIIWKNVKTMNQHGCMIKEYSDFSMPGYYMKDDEKETLYATCFGSGYIVMYAYHKYDQIINPYNLILFIQPTNESFLVNQYYTKEELYGLWIKMLNSLDDDTPDAVKAEDLKNEFINEYKTDLEDKKFKNVKLSSSDFSGANLSFSNFTGSDLRGANFNGANLSGSNLNGAILKGVKLSDIILDERYKIVENS